MTKSTPRMTKPIDLATDEDREWEVLEKAASNLRMTREEMEETTA